MKKKIHFILFCLTIFSITINFSSCIKPKNNNEKYKKIQPKRIIKDKILLILGKDYSNRAEILNTLKKLYDIGTDNKSDINIISYEDMTQNTKHPRLKMISEQISKQNSTIVISLGIPEGSGRYLIKELEKNTNLSIITLLPMDEILPLEAGSDLVIDFKLPTEILHEEKDFYISNDELEILIISSIFFGEYLNSKNKKLDLSPVESFDKILKTTQQFINKKIFNGVYQVKPYIDSDSGIPSRNYLLIQQNNETNEKTDNNNKNIDTENDYIINPDDLEGGA